ncbi:hypothetical protein LCGC14_2646230 [marine sediment metagenome]|uniref:DNA-binding phage zinc finger domain-containing protein n=1 Tax=marine sediment metagenome TaxID=412755 RepID=A0A0F9AIG2_9ZZZZ
MTKIANWKAELLGVPCPKCGAVPGVSCRTADGNIVDVADSHVARKRVVDSRYTGKRGPLDR